MERAFAVVVSDHQFVVHDAADDVDLAGFTYDYDDDEFEATERALLVGTRRAAGEVPVVFELRGAPLEPDLDRWDHAATGSLQVTAGAVTVSAPWSEPVAPPLVLPNGSYRCLVLWGDIATAEDDGNDGADHYRVVLWPGEATASRILKRADDLPEDDGRPGLSQPAEDSAERAAANGRLAAAAELLRRGDVSVRCHAAVALARLGTSESVTALSPALADSSDAVRRVATSALRLAGPAGVDALVRQLDNPDSGTRRRAAAALGRVRHDRTLDALLGALLDSEAAVREAAGESLAAEDVVEAAGAAAVVRRVGDLLEATDPVVRRTAVETLDRLRTGTAGTEEVLHLVSEPVTALLVDVDPEIRELAARVLAAAERGRPAGPTSEFGRLVAALRDPEPGVRAAACEALGALGDSRAIGPLAALLADPQGSFSTSPTPR